MHYCPHANRNCGPGHLCTPCSPGKGVLKDGEGISVSMMLRDSAPREMAATTKRILDGVVTDAIREEARRDHEAWKRNGQPIQHDGISEYHARVLAANAQSNAATLAQVQRQSAAMQAVRDHGGNASDNAYYAMCDELQNAHRRA